MAHAFDIRFGRSNGLAALFEAPANRSRWKGAGRLNIDGEVISIVGHRGLLTLFTRRTRHIAARDLTEVYREGNSLRLEFGTPDSREVLPLWANGSDTAAEIVKLLPTSRTVELEHSTAPGSDYRFDRSLIVWLAVSALALVFGAWFLWGRQATPAAAIHETEEVVAFQPAIPGAGAETPAPTAAGKIESVTKRPLLIARNSPAYPAARLRVDEFKADLADRLEELDEWLESPSPVELEAQLPRWDEMIERIQRNMGFQGPDLWLLRDVMVSICRDQQRFEEMFAQGLREHDSEWVDNAFTLRKLADAKLDWLNRAVP